MLAAPADGDQGHLGGDQLPEGSADAAFPRASDFRGASGAEPSCASGCPEEGSRLQAPDRGGKRGGGGEACQAAWRALYQE